MKVINLITSVINVEIILSVFMFVFFVLVGMFFLLMPATNINIMLGCFFLMVSIIIALVSFDLIRDNYREYKNNL